FGSTHGLAKLNRPTIALWARVLREIPQSRLLIARHTLTGSAADRLRQCLDDERIEPARYELRSQLPQGGHLGLYHDIDICLDAQPWSGHVTACQSMWMGVPMVTLLGQTRAGRMVASVLYQIGHPEWVAT